MKILEQIKQDQLTARKKKQRDLVGFYGLVISEIDRIGKNAGNRETTDDEAIATIKKMVSKNNEMLPLLSGDILTTTKLEIELLEKYLPSMVSNDDVAGFIDSLDATNIGMVMGAVKKKFGQTVDMKFASQYAKEKLL